MDLEQKLNKYFPKEWKNVTDKTTEKFIPPCVAFFRVQFYVENGKIISDKIARKLYYYHIKDQFLRSHCTHKEEMYFLLAAYALQADWGNQNTHMNNYFQPEAYFPHWIIAKRGTDYILKHVPEVHRELQGMSVKEAVLNFISKSCVLEDVPVHYYRLLKDKKEERPSIILGVTLRGIHIYQEVNHIHQLLYDFPWSNVGKLTFLGKKFEIQPDGLPSARKLVYYTGCPFRSQHLLHLLSNSHRLYLNIQPVLKEIKKVEEAEEKKIYRESCVSGNMEMDLDQLDKYSHGSSRGSGINNCLSRQSTVSHSSSHTSSIEADSHHRMSEEMSVDEPFGNEVLQLSKKSLPSIVCQSIPGIEYGTKERMEGDSQNDEVEFAVDNHDTGVIDLVSDISVLESEEQCVDFPILDNHNWQIVKLRKQKDHFQKVNTSKLRNSTDRYSQSLDDVRIYNETHSPFATAVLTCDTSQSYTFGSTSQENIIDCNCTYITSNCKVKSTLLGKSSMNSLSLDLLGEDQFLEFIL